MSEPGGADLFLGAFIDLGNKIDSVRQSVDEPPKPVQMHKRIFGTATITAPSPTVIFPQNPPAGVPVGFMWNIRAVALTGPTDAHTALAGITGVEFYCGQQQVVGTTSQPYVADMPDLMPDCVFTSAPCSKTLTRHLIWAQEHDMPYALVYGGTIGAQLFLLAIAEEWCIEDVVKMKLRGRRNVR